MKFKKYTFIRAFLNINRILWLIRVKLFNKSIPLKTLPSYEHRHILKINPFPEKIIDVGFNKGQFSSLILLFKKKHQYMHLIQILEKLSLLQIN